MVATDVMEPAVVAPGSPKTVYFLTVIVTSLNSTAPLQDAAKIYSQAREDGPKLLAEHVAAWSTRWEQGSLEVAGDLFLAQALNSSLYAIRASIRSDWPFGLSPGGLASNAYEGHTLCVRRRSAVLPLHRRLLSCEGVRAAGTRKRGCGRRC